MKFHRKRRNRAEKCLLILLILPLIILCVRSKQETRLSANLFTIFKLKNAEPGYSLILNCLQCFFNISPNNDSREDFASIEKKKGYNLRQSNDEVVCANASRMLSLL